MYLVYNTVVQLCQFFCLAGNLIFVRFTLFYSTLLALTDRQTDSQTDSQTDRETNTLALRGLEEPAHASRGLEEPFFQLCWFWFYILLMYLGYRTIQLWCCVSFFDSGGK